MTVATDPHLSLVQPVTPQTPEGCEECLALGSPRVGRTVDFRNTVITCPNCGRRNRVPAAMGRWRRAGRAPRRLPACAPEPS